MNQEVYQYMVLKNRATSFAVGGILCMAMGTISLFYALGNNGLYVGVAGTFVYLMGIFLSTLAIAMLEQGRFRAFYNRLVDFDYPALNDWKRTLEAHDAFAEPEELL